jgi:hypothetical protein
MFVYHNAIWTGKKFKDQIYLELEKTRRGLHAAWEVGGGHTNTGSAQLIANADGSPKKPIYIPKRGPKCGGHALFVLEVNDIIISTYHHRKNFEHYVYRVKRIRPLSRRFWADKDELNYHTPFELAVFDIKDNIEEGEIPRNISLMDINVSLTHEEETNSVWIKYETGEMVADLEVLNWFHEGKWKKGGEPSGPVADAIRVATKKATDFHCRKPYYFKN